MTRFPCCTERPQSLRQTRTAAGWCLGLCVAWALGGCGSVSLAPDAVNPTSPGRASPPLIQAEQAQDVTIRALGLVGTPYRYGGNTPESGFDCSGLIGYVYLSQAGVKAPRTVAQLGKWGQSVSEAQLRAGDLVLFSQRAGSPPHHAGIYVGQGRFVHAPSTGGEVRLDRLESKYWSALNVTFRRP